MKTPKERKALIEEHATSVNQKAFSVFKKLIMAVQPEDGAATYQQ